MGTLSRGKFEEAEKEEEVRKNRTAKRTAFQAVNSIIKD